MTGAFIEKNLAELRDKEAQHILEVRTLNGERLDLSTLAVLAKTPASPAPVFKLDSAKDDDNAGRGRYIPSMLGDDEMPKGAPSLLAQKDRDVEMGSSDNAPSTAAEAAEASEAPAEEEADAPPPVFEQVPLSASAPAADTMKASSPPAPPVKKKKF